MVGSNNRLPALNSVRHQFLESLGGIAFFMALVADDTAQGIENLNGERAHAISDVGGRRREESAPFLDRGLPEAAQDRRVAG